jgi:hypothetical protein
MSVSRVAVVEAREAGAAQDGTCDEKPRLVIDDLRRR